MLQKKDPLFTTGRSIRCPIFKNGINPYTDKLRYICVRLSECKEIITYGKNWTEVFEGAMVVPGEEKIAGGKSVKSEWLSKLNSIRNKLDKPTFSVSSEEYTYIKKIYAWLVQGS